MEKTEDRLRATVQRNELTLKSLRSKLVTCLTFRDGAFVVDKRYQSEANELLNQEQVLRASTNCCESALNRAVELVKDLKGLDMSYPYTSIRERCKALQTEISGYETNITVYKRRIETHGGLTTGEWQDRIKEHEAQLKQLRPELSKIKSIESEIERLFQSAMKGS